MTPINIISIVMVGDILIVLFSSYVEVYTKTKPKPQSFMEFKDQHGGTIHLMR